jgi:hypothetical protein
VKVCIPSRINVDGEWWDIQTEHHIPDKTPGKDKIDTIQAVIRGLKVAGLISRVGAKNPPQKVFTGSAGPTDTVPASTSPSMTWPMPHCPVHREVLRQSKVQKKSGVTAYFCPKKLGEDYCPHRATVNNENGFPVFWEVNEK